MKKWMSIWMLLFVAAVSISTLNGCEASIDTDDDWDDEASVEVDVDD